MEATQSPDTEIVTGAVVGVITKAADKWQVEVQPPDSQYTKKLWTKDPQLVGQISQQIGQTLAFICGVSNWTRADGQPVRSLWVNGVGQPGMAPAAPAPAAPVQGAQVFHGVQPAGGGPAPAAAQAPAPPAQAAPVQQDDREVKIHRQTATKVAVQLLPYLQQDQRNFGSLLQIAERLVAYYNFGVSWDADAAAPNPDDDIPF